jgi:hypothetical protein
LDDAFGDLLSPEPASGLPGLPELPGLPGGPSPLSSSSSATTAKKKVNLSELLASGGASSSRGSISGSPAATTAIVDPFAPPAASSPQAANVAAAAVSEGVDDEAEDEDDFGSFSSSSADAPASSPTGSLPAPAPTTSLFGVDAAATFGSSTATNTTTSSTANPLASPSPPLNLTSLSTSPVASVSPAAAATGASPAAASSSASAPEPPVFSFSEQAAALALPEPLVVRGRIPADFGLTEPRAGVVAPGASDDGAEAASAGVPAPRSSALEEAFAALVRSERFVEARAAHAQVGVASEIAKVSAEYKAALAAAEESEDEEEALARAMALGKRLKVLKASKPDEKWMRDLTLAEAKLMQAQGTLLPTHAQLVASLARLDGDDGGAEEDGADGASSAWTAAFEALYPPPSFDDLIAEPAQIDKALQTQKDAWAFVQDVLGPVFAASYASSHATGEDASNAAAAAVASLRERLATVLSYALAQLSTAESFVREASTLDLSDAARHDSAALTTVLSAPDSRARTCLTGAAVLYRIVLRVEFSLALFEGLDANANAAADASLTSSCARAHELWLSLLQHVLSAPLQPLLSEWLPAVLDSVDAAQVRQQLQENNAPERLCERRGRHACALCLANQEQDGMHTECAALQSKLFAQ